MKHMCLWTPSSRRVCLRGRGVLGDDDLGALGDSVFGELVGEVEAHDGLDLVEGESVLVVADELVILVGDLVKDVRDERVHDGHDLGRDVGVGVHLLDSPSCLSSPPWVTFRRDIYWFIMRPMFCRLLFIMNR